MPQDAFKKYASTGYTDLAGISIEIDLMNHLLPLLKQGTIPHTTIAYDLWYCSESSFTALYPSREQCDRENQQTSSESNAEMQSRCLLKQRVHDGHSNRSTLVIIQEEVDMSLKDLTPFLQKVFKPDVKVCHINITLKARPRSDALNTKRFDESPDLFLLFCVVCMYVCGMGLISWKFGEVSCSKQCLPFLLYKST